MRNRVILWFIVCLCLILSGCTDNKEEKIKQYDFAVSQFKDGYWEDADKTMASLGDFPNAKEVSNFFKAKLAIKNTPAEKMKTEGYPKALEYLNSIPSEYSGDFYKEIDAMKLDINARASEFSFLGKSYTSDGTNPTINYSLMKPQIGMTAAEVVKTSWGRPNDINRTTTASNIHEQWVYYGGRYVYLDNGIVTTIQE